MFKNTLSKHIEKLDKAAPKRLIKINMFISVFVCLAHGPALVLPLFSNIKDFQSVPLLVFFSVPLALSAFIYAIYGLRKPEHQINVLKYHAALLLIMLGAIFIYSAFILINGIPIEKTRFVWNPILFAFLLSYPVYLARLVFAKNKIEKYFFIKYAHIYAVLLSAVISALIIGQM